MADETKTSEVAPLTEATDVVLKQIFVKDITASISQFVDVFLVQSAAAREAKNGNKYLSMVLGDKTGTIDAKFWEANNPIPAPGTFIKVEAVPNVYKDVVQLKLNRWRALRDDEVSIEDFLPVSKFDRDELMQRLTGAVSKIVDDDLHGLLFKIIYDDDIRLALRNAPAAKGNHQPYLGGLLEHILGIIALVNAVCNLYPVLDRDLMVAAAVVHDIGKIRELTFERAIGYSRIGKLVGHIALGLQIVSKFEHLLSPKTRDHLYHIILSHHDRPEWGSPKAPMTREAAIFHRLDYIDARMATADIVSDLADDTGFTPYQNSFESALYFPERDKSA